VILVLIYAKSTRVEEFDFPNEGNSIKQRIATDTIIKNIGAIIGIEPRTVCISVTGVDPRVIYAKAKSTEPDFGAGLRPSYIEGHHILLFASSNSIYIEKFDRTFVYFDVAGDYCREMSASFQIILGPPTGRYPYAKYSAELKF